MRHRSDSGTYRVIAVSLRLPEPIHRNLKSLAEREGISSNQLINSAVAEKLAALMTEQYLEERAARGSRASLREILAKVPDVEPEPGDRLL